jgi:hypothetical protein
LVPDIPDLTARVRVPHTIKARIAWSLIVWIQWRIISPIYTIKVCISGVTMMGAYFTIFTYPPQNGTTLAVIIRASGIVSLRDLIGLRPACDI